MLVNNLEIESIGMFKNTLFKITPQLFPFLTLFEVSLFWHRVWLTFVLLELTSALAIYFSSNRIVTFYLWICVSLGGPVAEIVAIHFGAWKYTLASQPLTIPLWLSPCWGLAGIFFYNVSKRIESTLNKNKE